MLMLRHDGEVWEVARGAGTDENTVKARVARRKKYHPEGDHDQKAIDAGVELVQTMYGGDLYHEIKQVK